MRRLQSMLGQPEFAVLLALLGFLALNWPFLEIARQGGNFAFFLYLFGVWAGAILLAYLVSRALAEQEPEPDDDV